MRSSVDNPMQPIIKVDGIDRFKENKIVRYLLDKGGIDLNHLATCDFSDDDSMQFAQLIGYSLCGFGELGYTSDQKYMAATNMLLGFDQTEARMIVAEELLSSVREAIRPCVPELFSIHPDDLNGES